jgi:pimeloyl-ACP methyl ester carboxylesterase
MTELRTEKPQVAFDEALANPTVIGKGEASKGYRLYSFENDRTERPLVVYFGLGTTALTAMGRVYLREYIDATDRPIVTLQPIVNEWTSFSARAESDSRVLALAGFEEMDIVGASSGALLAGYVAAHAGAHVKHLVTASCVGTKDGYGEYTRGLPGQFIDGIKESFSILREKNPLPVFTSASSQFFNITQYNELIKTMRQAVKGSLWDVAPALDKDTKWIDIVGTRDHMTSYEDHLKIIRERNTVYPRSSAVHLLGGESHMWAAKRALLAKLVRDAIEKC